MYTPGHSGSSGTERAPLLVSRQPNKASEQDGQEDGRGSRPAPVKSDASQSMVLVALMLSMTLCGWNAGSLGPLLPALQSYYHVNYSTISLIFVANFVGALLAGTTNVFITDRIGYRFTAPLGAFCHVLTYGILAQGLPYRFFLGGIVLGGFALCLQDAQVNNIGCRLRNGPTKLSIVQACFSIGGTLSPFFATPFAERVPDRPYLYFYIAMAVAAFTWVIMLLAFMRGGIEDIIAGETDKLVSTGAGYDALEDELRQQQEQDVTKRNEDDHSWGKIRRMVTNPLVLSLMFWSFLYSGAESTTSGYLTTFLIHDRGAPLSAGYATMGFWIGMSIGRIAMVPVTERMGYRYAGLVYALVSGVAAAAVWASRSIIFDSVGYCVIGFMFGPMYPTGLMIVSQTIDDDLRVGVMGLMGSFGGVGAALWPFLVGVLSDRYGIWTLQPVIIGLIVVFTLMWIHVTVKH